MSFRLIVLKTVEYFRVSEEGNPVLFPIRRPPAAGLLPAISGENLETLTLLINARYVTVTNYR
jgi:hypothetical protein